jgi:ATP-binding cassette subfamily G (WHITE) protein 2
VLAELGLSHVAASLVGGSANIRGVSGGERRRVTIAMALVTRPRLVIMDEPTSGLDSYTAYNLMRTAQDIARHGRVVIMSLHQPSPDMFDSLTQVLLLAKGRLAYLGAPSNVGPHFAAAGYPIPPGRQPAEHMLHVASQGSGLEALLRYGARSPEPAALQLSKSGLGKAPFRPHIIAEATVSGSTEPSIDEEWHLPAVPGPNPMPLGLPVSGGPACALPPWGVAATAAQALAAARPRPSARLSHWFGGQARECSVLYWRAFTNMRREPRLLTLHMVVALALGLVVGAVFFRLDASNVGLQNRLGSMFFALALFGWTSVSVVDGLVLERELVEREVAGHYYGGVTYLLSSLVLDGLLLRTLPALLFCALMYPMVRRHSRGCSGVGAGGNLFCAPHDRCAPSMVGAPHPWWVYPMVGAQQGECRQAARVWPEFGHAQAPRRARGAIPCQPPRARSPHRPSPFRPRPCPRPCLPRSACCPRCRAS